MRKIHKQGNEPNALEERRLGDAPFGWGEINDDPDLKATIKEALLDEQGELCAYTGIRIGTGSAHIEHLKPRAHDWEGHTDVSYENMVACHTEKGSTFGATYKGDWPSPSEWDDFITPLDERCEQSFRYETDGSIRAAGNNLAAERTIENLNLDHPELEDLRADAVEGMVETFSQTNVRALKTAVRQKVDRLRRRMRQTDPNRLPEFVFVLVDALETHVS
jgi:uncharacterized protein (TIGR02646 family)